jgi:hypothetical protein
MMILKSRAVSASSSAASKKKEDGVEFVLDERFMFRLEEGCVPKQLLAEEEADTALDFKIIIVFFLKFLFVHVKISLHTSLDALKRFIFNLETRTLFT